MKFKSGEIVDLARRIIDILKDEGLLDNCTTCMHWNEKEEICNKFKQRPPAKVIITGCEHHELIPF
jgi:hypothetical protein